MSTEEPLLKLENSFSTLAELARRSEERTDTLIELARNHDERMDDFDKKLAALVEAQARTEANLSALTVIVTDLGRAQSETNARLDRLTENVDRFIAGQNGGAKG